VDALPDWLTPLPDAERMRAIDRWAIEVRGVPSLDLMERAGAGVTRAVERIAPDGPVAVVCGAGNNGGDGFVVARLLRDAGREVSVLLAGSREKLTGDARVNLERLEDPERRHGGAPPMPDGYPPVRDFPDGVDAIARASVVVDALLGTGFEGEPRGAVGEAIEAIETGAAAVVSVDVPSGVDASTGVVSGVAVHAAVTVTFHTAKPGLWIDPGKSHAGTLEVIDIGIPRGGPGPRDAEIGEAGSVGAAAVTVTAGIGLIEPAVLDLLAHRGARSTKFSSGHVLVAGGSRGLTGAPRMAALGAMRTGAGYVTACVPASLQAILAGGGAPPELMTRGLPDENGMLTPAGVEVVLEASRRGGALALGPGLGRGEPTVAFARALAARAQVPLVLDADGLNAHAPSNSHAGGHLDDLARRGEIPTVLTPHPGELGRLLDTDAEQIAAERLAHVREAASRAQAVVVLKGDDTLVADPVSGVVAVSPGDSPALATAGTGDVLCGAIAALLAQGLPAFAAAAAGVLLHVRAGRIAARTVGAAEGVIASDVISCLPAARTVEA